MHTKHGNISDLKKKAIALRVAGNSYPEIEKKLNIARSTLSGWFSSLVLPDEIQKFVSDRKMKHLDVIRKLASQAHINNRLNKVRKINDDVEKQFGRLAFDNNILELILAALYLGEGFKKQAVVGLGNSNSDIVCMFVSMIRRVYSVDEKRFKCCLYLRMDQDSEKEVKFWSKILSIPAAQFGKPQFDRRTIGKKTYLGYHGVCAVYCYNADIAKRLLALQNMIKNRCTGV